LGTNFQPLDKPKRLYVSNVPSHLPPTDVIAIEDNDTASGFVPDYDTIVDKVIKAKVEKILKVAGISWDEIIGQSTFEGFG